MPMGSRRHRTEQLEHAVSHLLERVRYLESTAQEKAPASETDRPSQAFELSADRAPISEVERLNHAFAEDYSLRSLGELQTPRLVGLDPALSPRSPLTIQPLLHDCFKPASFDLILCVSPIEHTCGDNTMYGLDGGRDRENPDIVAVKTMSEWLAPEGVSWSRFHLVDTRIMAD